MLFCLLVSGPHRGGSQSCYHAECDSVRNGNSAPFADEDFFLHTVQTLLDTTVELSQAQCQDGFGYRRSKEDEGEGGSSHHGHSSWIQSSFLLLTASMILCNL